MDPIIQGAVVNVTATLKQGGVPYAIPDDATVSAQFTSVDGAAVLIPTMALSSATAGSDWPVGVIVVPLSNAQTAALPIGDVLMRVTVNGLTWLIPMEVVLAVDARTGTALFPNPAAAIAKMRRDRLLLLARSALPGIELSDEFLWDKLTSAEARIAHELRVPLGPTRFFPLDPTQGEIDALAGAAWDIDPPYDWEPENFLDNKWGYLLLRNKPLIDVIGIRVAYPSAQNTVLDVPADWIRLDKKYGHVNLVPSSPLAMQAFGATLMPLLSGGRRMPFSVHISYTAGLQNVQRDYPDLLDAVFKQAAIGIIEDSYLPQSGSISADGLSQSMSVDTSKYYDSIDRILNGKDGNGGLMAKIHGIRLMVM